MKSKCTLAPTGARLFLAVILLCQACAKPTLPPVVVPEAPVEPEVIKESPVEQPETPPSVAGETIPEPLPKRIGVLLPLTGGRAELGRRAANAIRLALEVEGQESGAQLFVRDTGGDQLQAIRAALELVRDDQVVCVIGPLLSEAVMGGAAVTEASSLPLLSPTATDPRLATIGEHVFLTNVSTAAQGRRMAQCADLSFLCRRMVIVHGNTAHGETAAVAFQEAFEATGGTIVSVERFGGANPDFDALALRIKALRPDGIFLPVADRHVLRLAPLLLYHNVHAALLGASGWLSDQLVEAGDQYLGGSVFTVPFNERASDPATRFFVDAYRDAYGSSPDLVAAMAWDCTRLALLGLREAPTSTEELRDRLAFGMDFHGATGAHAFDDEGRSTAEPQAVTLHRGRLDPIVAAQPPIIAAPRALHLSESDTAHGSF